MENEKKNKTKEYNKKYYLAHRDQMLEYGKKKITCEHCDKSISRNNLIKHQNTKKCLLLRTKLKFE